MNTPVQVVKSLMMIIAALLSLTSLVTAATSPLKTTMAWLQHLGIPESSVKGTIESLISLDDFVSAGALDFMETGDKLAMYHDISTKFHQELLGLSDEFVGIFLKEVICDAVGQLFQTSRSEGPLSISQIPTLNLNRDAERTQIISSWSMAGNQAFQGWLSSLMRIDLSKMTHDQIARDIKFGIYRLKHRMAFKVGDVATLKRLQDLSVAIVEDRLLGRLDELKAFYGRLFQPTATLILEEIKKKVEVFSNYYLGQNNMVAFEVMAGVLAKVEVITQLVKRDGPCIPHAQLNILIGPNLIAMREALAPLERVDMAIFMKTVTEYALALNGTPLI